MSEPLDALNKLKSITGRDDLTGPIAEELLRTHTKLTALETKLAIWAAKSLWKIAWHRIKAKWPKINPNN